MSLAGILKQKSPCEKFECRNFTLCKEEKMACLSFAKFVDSGRAVNPHHGINGVPTNQQYRKLFPAEAVCQ